MKAVGSDLIRVIVADDHPVYLDGMVRAFSACADLHVVGEATQGEDALRLISAEQPDVAVLDVRMPLLDGTEIVGRLRADGVATRVLLVSGHVDADLRYRAIAAGASGFLPKESPRAEVCEAVRRIAAGELVLTPPSGA